MPKTPAESSPIEDVLETIRGIIAAPVVIIEAAMSGARPEAPIHCPKRRELFEFIRQRQAMDDVDVEDLLTIDPVNKWFDDKKVPLEAEALEAIKADVIAKAAMPADMELEARTGREMAHQAAIACAFGKSGSPSGRAGFILHTAFGASKGAVVLSAPFADDASVAFHMAQPERS